MKTKNKLLKGLLIGAFLLATNFLVAQTNISPFQTVCAGSVEPYLINPTTLGSTYQWTLSGGGTLNNGSSSAITVDWGMTPGIYTVSVIETDINGCPGAQVTVDVTVISNTTPTFTPVGPYCSGEVIPDLPTTSNNGVTGTWSPAISNTATTTYTFTPTAGLCAPTQTLTITITPNTTPTFTPVGPYCTGAIITDLPITSSNGVTGTWAPASVSNTATTTYTFTPAAGLCSPTLDLTITINPLPSTGPINHW